MLRFAVVASLAANAALGVLWWQLPATPDGPPPPASALPPAEYRDFVRRGLPGVLDFAVNAAVFRPTQAEFDAIGTLLESQFTAGLDEASLQVFRTQLAAALGPERFADFNQATSGTMATNRFVARLGLPLSAAATIDTTRQEMAVELQKIKNNPTLAPAERDARLAALAVEARRRITAATSPAGYDAYYEYLGDWIKDITGSPPPPGP